MPLDPALYRPLFPVCSERVYLNHAGVSPCSTRVAGAVCDWVNDLSREGMAPGWRWEERIEEVRAAAARLLGAEPGEIAFVRSTSHGLSLVAEGLDWRPGDEVVVAGALEYPSNVFPWTRLADRGVIAREPAASQRGVTVAGVEEAMTPRTRVVAVSSVQFATGHRTDLEGLAALCRQRDVLLVVDAIQSLGAFPLDARGLGLAAAAACSHKWLLGLLGAGVAYIDRELAGRLRPPLVGWRSTRDEWDFDGTRFELKGDCRRFEEGTLPYALIDGLGEALALLEEVGVAAIAEHITGLLARLEVRLDAAGCPLSPPASERAGILLFEVPPGAPVDTATLHARLEAEGFATALRRGRIRVAPHLYNTADEIDRLADAIDAALAG